MATHAATLHKQISTEVKGVGPLRDSIFCVTLLATSFSIFLLEHGPEPELVLAMSFYFTGGCAPVTPVTTGAAKLLGFMDRKNLFVWMTDKRAPPGIRCLPWPIGGLVFGTNIERFTNSRVTNFTAVHDIVFIDTDLMAQDRIIV